jgi:LPXTG-site transpeptidase (sortase) family protein
MLFNSQGRRYAVLMVGIILMTSSINRASTTNSTILGSQSVLQGSLLTTEAALTANMLVLPAASSSLKLVIPTTESEPLNLAPSATMVVLEQQTIKTLKPTPKNDESELYSKENRKPIEPILDIQPEIDRNPTRLVIPIIELDAPVEVVSWHVEKVNDQNAKIWGVPDHFAAGWLASSAPLGLPGNTVLDGHHNIKGKVFRNLVDLRVGDTILLYSTNFERVYRVSQVLILQEAGQPLEIRKSNAKYIGPTEDERLTLVTCWPPTGNSYRLIIIAKPIQIDPRFAPEQSSDNSKIG